MSIFRSLFAAALATFVLLIHAAPASADHTDPREPLSSTNTTSGVQGLANGEGTWEHLFNFPPNPGTDLKFFRKAKRTFVASGTLGQGNEQHVGQRILRLLGRSGKVKVKWVADHGSANCSPGSTGVTSLQHDVAVTPKGNPKLLIDTTDTTSRCHDPGGGGLEIVDISKIHRKKFAPREIHLTRHQGTTHTVTVDATRPWIVYNNSSEAAARPWIDVLDIRSCLGKGSLKQKRARCRPKVYRILFRPEWAQRIDGEGNRVEGTESSCHDITARRGRIYCANLNSTVIIDVRRLTKPNGAVRGTPLPCKVVDGTDTAAKVTDCNDLPEDDFPEAEGWNFLGAFNHPGRNGSHNSNTEYTVREGISVAHEADPTPDNQWLFVTDERGGGVAPGGASCTTETENPFGNGGVHVFDISNPANIEYARTPDDQNAVFIGNVTVPSPTFCTAHVMEQIPREQRFVIAWYSQGVKIVDYFIDDDGRWTFRETASLVLPNANTWTAEDFKIVRNDDGTRTYHFMTSDIERGIDVLTWTGPANPMGTPPPASSAQRT